MKKYKNLCALTVTITLALALQGCNKEDVSVGIPFNTCGGTVAKTIRKTNRAVSSVQTYASVTFNQSASCKLNMAGTSCNLVYGYTNPYSAQTHLQGEDNFFYWTLAGASTQGGTGTGCSGTGVSASPYSGNCGQTVSFQGATNGTPANVPIAFTKTVMKAGSYSWKLMEAEESNNSATGVCGPSLPACAGGPLSVRFHSPFGIVTYDKETSRVNVTFTVDSESNVQSYKIMASRPCDTTQTFSQVGGQISYQPNNAGNYTGWFGVGQADGGIWEVKIVQVDLNGGEIQSEAIKVRVGKK